MFRNQFNFEARSKIKTVPGNKEKDLYRLKLDDDGRRVCVSDSKVNLYAEIQSHRLSCDVNYLIAKYVNGDKQALNRVQGMFGDFTQLPNSYAEMQQRVEDAKSLFNKLPVEQKKKFNNSASEFVAAFGTPEFYEALGIVPKVQNNVQIKKDEVKEVENNA